jgi:hypothetical protein
LPPSLGHGGELPKEKVGEVTKVAVACHHLLLLLFAAAAGRYLSFFGEKSIVNVIWMDLILLP